jgi:hypothetical protein
MEAIGVALPLIPVFCGQLMKFGADKAWGAGLDRFAVTASRAGAQSIAVCLSPAGNGKDSYHKVWRLFNAMHHLRSISGLPVFAWRQGVFGPALVALASTAMRPG